MVLPPVGVDRVGESTSPGNEPGTCWFDVCGLALTGLLAGSTVLGCDTDRIGSSPFTEPAVDVPGVDGSPMSEKPARLAGGLTLTDAVGESVRKCPDRNGRALDVIWRDSGGAGGSTATGVSVGAARVSNGGVRIPDIGVDVSWEPEVKS